MAWFFESIILHFEVEDCKKK